jgi:thioredoxin 1
VAIVILLLTAGFVIWGSWQSAQKEPCPVKIVNVTSNATVVATKAAQVTQNTTAKKTLVFLYMDNCPYCEQMKPVINDLITKSYNSTTFDVLQVNIDSTPGAAAQYGVVSTPTMVILQNGKEINRFTGVVSEDTLLNALK